MELNNIEKFFVENSKALLSTVQPPEIPGWMSVKDPSKPAQPTRYSLSYKLVIPEEGSRTLRVGDKFDVVYTVYPQVRIDGNIIVRFNKDEVEVVRSIDNLESFITGVLRFVYIQKAKSALGKDLVKVEVLAVYECFHTSTSIRYPLKTVGAITVKKIKI